MKRLILWIIIVAISGLMAYRFLERRQERASRTISEIQAVEGYPVEVTTVVSAPFRLTRNYTGTLAGREEAEIVPLVGEYITKVMVKEGQRVAAGETICELSRDNPSAAYQQSRLALENAERELTRVQALFDKGAVSRQMLDGMVLQRDISKRNFETAEQLLTITSPISGIVSELSAETGKFTIPGMPIGKVVSTDRMRVKFEVPSVDREEVRIGTHCRINSGGVEATGKVERIALSVDKEGRSFTTWAALDNRPEVLLFSPGLMVNVEVFVIDVPEAVVVPTLALNRSGDSWRVYVIEGDRAKSYPIILGGRSSEFAWIRSGVEVGKSVVITGAELLSDGVLVRVIKKG